MRAALALFVAAFACSQLAAAFDGYSRDDFALVGILEQNHARHDHVRFLNVQAVEERRQRDASHPSAQLIAKGIRYGYRDDVSALHHERVKQQLIPDPGDKETVLRLAEMSFNAYENYNTSTDWKIVSGWDPTLEYGWNSDNLQGYIYLNYNRTVGVMVIKGTSLLFLGQGGPTAENDKLVDNLMFSCCCARVNDRWDPVCDCYRDDQTCSSSCLSTTLTNNSLSYYNLAQQVFEQAKIIYPGVSWWFTGHSLGGSLASLLAVRYNAPAFAYEAPGELLYAQRIGLKINTTDMSGYNIFHYGNTGDPIFLGTCQGVVSSCYISGYALETGCHVGHVCIYDGAIVTNPNNHRISVVIDKFIEPNPVPPCTPQNNCKDCTAWTFL